ncbi:MAG: 30S ribosomal protein S18, partial [Elusimicrobia bacterium]|nr:30S ribosomal protein S18 [Elusimicrobiota bacterium]
MRVRTRCKICRYDKEIDYKDLGLLERYIDRRGKLLPKSFTGTCA